MTARLGRGGISKQRRFMKKNIGTDVQNIWTFICMSVDGVIRSEIFCCSDMSSRQRATRVLASRGLRTLNVINGYEVI